VRVIRELVGKVHGLVPKFDRFCVLVRLGLQRLGYRSITHFTSRHGIPR
jgi:hypothetical protein